MLRFDARHDQAAGEGVPQIVKAEARGSGHVIASSGCLHVDQPLAPPVVSNSLSGGDRQLDEAPAVREPAQAVEIGRDHRMPSGKRQRRVSVQ